MFDDKLRAERDKDWDEWKEKYGFFRDGHPSDRDKTNVHDGGRKTRVNNSVGGVCILPLFYVK